MFLNYFLNPVSYTSLKLYTYTIYSVIQKDGLNFVSLFNN